MKKTFSLFFIVLCLIIFNLSIFTFSPINSLVNIFLLLIILYIIYFKKGTLEDFGDTYYDYDVENPNALVSGRPVGGTVYASSGKQVGGLGGLGWII